MAMDNAQAGDIFHVLYEGEEYELAGRPIRRCQGWVVEEYVDSMPANGEFRIMD